MRFKPAFFAAAVAALPSALFAQIPGQTAPPPPKVAVTQSATGFDATGYPTRWTGASVSAFCAGWGGYQQCPPGSYTLLWDDTSAGHTADVRLSDYGISTAKKQTEIIGQATNNQRVYAVTISDPTPPATNGGSGSGATASLQVLMCSPGATNIRLYYTAGLTQDVTDPAHPTVTDHNMLTNLSQVSCMRTLGMGDSIAGSVVDYADFSSPDACCYPGVYNYAHIASIANYPLDSPYAAFGGKTPLLVTTTAPNTFKDGQTINFGNGLASSPQWSDKQTDTITYGLSVIKIIDNTHFLISRSKTLAQPYTGAAKDQVYVLTKSCMPPYTMAQMAKEAKIDLWYCAPYAITNDCATALGNMFATTLSKTQKLDLEVSDEWWNWGFPFCITYGYYVGFGALQTPPMSPGQYYTYRTMQIANAMRAAFVAHGRPASDVQLILGGMAYWSEPTQDVITAWNALNPGYYPYAVAIAPYFSNQLAKDDKGTALGFNADNLDLDQSLDILELAIDDGNTDPAGAVAGNYALLTQKSLGNWQAHGVKLVCYEGGPSYLQIGGTEQQSPGSYHYLTDPLTNLTPMRRSQLTELHPRFRNLMLHYMQKLQENGVALFMQYEYSATYNCEQKGSIYGAYLGTAMQPGLGDGTDGRFDNRANFGDLTKNVSVLGGAMRDWGQANKTITGSSPTVSITAPGKDTVFTYPHTTVTLSVSASETHGEISRVQFYFNGAPIGAPISQAPFTASVTLTTLGKSTLTAVVYDTNGIAVTSTPVHITLAAPNTPQTLIVPTLAYAWDAQQNGSWGYYGWTGNKLTMMPVTAQLGNGVSRKKG